MHKYENEIKKFNLMGSLDGDKCDRLNRLCEEYGEYFDFKFIMEELENCKESTTNVRKAILEKADIIIQSVFDTDEYTKVGEYIYNQSCSVLGRHDIINDLIGNFVSIAKYEEKDWKHVRNIVLSRVANIAYRIGTGENGEKEKLSHKLFSDSDNRKLIIDEKGIRFKYGWSRGIKINTNNFKVTKRKKCNGRDIKYSLVVVDGKGIALYLEDVVVGDRRFCMSIIPKVVDNGVVEIADVYIQESYHYSLCKRLQVPECEWDKISRHIKES